MPHAHGRGRGASAITVASDEDGRDLDAISRGDEAAVCPDVRQRLSQALLHCRGIGRTRETGSFHGHDDARIIASGGVNSLADIAALRALGIEGAIVGKALYQGAFTLADALAVAGCEED